MPTPLIAIRGTTKPSHAALEGLLIPHLKSLSGISEYHNLLLAFYGYIHPLEANIEKHISLTHFPDYPNRRKSHVLLEDIAATGMPMAASDIPLADQLPRVSDTYDAAGALYVLEGSTLGGQIITKMLQSRLGLANLNSLQYFNGYGERNGLMWSKFTSALDTLTDDQAHIGKIVATANETFIHFYNWLARQFTAQLVASPLEHERTS